MGDGTGTQSITAAECTGTDFCNKSAESAEEFSLDIISLEGLTSQESFKVCICGGATSIGQT